MDKRENQIINLKGFNDTSSQLGISFDEESPVNFNFTSYEELFDKHQLLKTKYTKLYKEHVLLLNILETEDLEKKKSTESKGIINSLGAKINLQEQEIIRLRRTIDSLNIQIDLKESKVTKRPINRNSSFSITDSSSLELNVSSLEISADISLMNFLVHRLLLKQSIERDDLLQYRFALQRIEDRFEELSNRLQLIY